MAIPIAAKLEQLRPNLYRLCAPNPGPMTGPGTNTYLYGNKELAVFDPGPNIETHIAAILAAQSSLGASITKIFASHTHQDHSPAVFPLSKALGSVEIIGAPAPENAHAEDLSFQPSIVPVDGQQFDVDSKTVTAVYTPGHVGNHFCYLLEEHRVLLTGDHLMSGSTVVIIPPKGSMRDYIASLEKLQDYAIDVLAPGHGDLVDKPQELIAWTIAHRLKREAKVVDKLELDQAQSLGQLVSKVYDDVDKKLHGIAELSLHAHLIKLEQDGRAKTADGFWSLARNS